MAESAAAKRDRLLAALGLTVNLLGFGAIALAIASPDPLHSANLVLALAAGLPAASTGTVACGDRSPTDDEGLVAALIDRP